MTMSSLLSTSFVAVVAVYLSAAPCGALDRNTFVASYGGGSTCSRAAPCADFQTAHDVTEPGGDLTCVDSGNFAGAGTFTIAKTITIDCGGAVGTHALNNLVISQPGITVKLRNLNFAGQIFGGTAIDFMNGVALYVENCTILTWARGIRFTPPNGVAAKLFVTDTVISNTGIPSGGGGIVIQPAGTGSALVTLNRVTLNGNTHGIIADGTLGTGSIVVQVNDSLVAGSLGNGIWAKRAGIVVDRSASKSNAGYGILADGGGSLVHLGHSTVAGNGAGLGATGGGFILSYQNNQTKGNGIDNPPTGVLTLN